MKFHDCARVIIHFLLRECFQEQHEDSARASERGLHNIREEFLRRIIRIGVAKILPAPLLMLIEIVIAAVCEPHEFSPTPRVLVLDIDRTAAVMGAFFIRVLTDAQALFADAEVCIPLHCGIQPLLEVFFRGARSQEVFDFHLFEFPCAEGEVSGSNFIPEGFPDLRDTKGETRAHRVEDIFEIHEHPLCRFRTEVNIRALPFNHPLLCTKHQVEFLCGRPVTLSTLRTGNFLRHHHWLYLLDLQNCNSLYSKFLFQQFISAGTCMTFSTFHKRIAKITDMAACFPYFGMHENRSLDLHHLRFLPDESVPPALLHPFLEFRAERPVIPGIGQSSINFRTREDESTALTETDDLVEGVGWHCGKNSTKGEGLLVFSFAGLLDLSLGVVPSRKPVTSKTSK